jgi:hypothetical protein
VSDDGAATYEAEVGDGLLHAGTGGLGDAVRVVEDVGNGAGGGAGPPRDVDELRAVVALPPWCRDSQVDGVSKLSEG